VPAAAFTVSVSEVEWLNEPEAPVNCTVAVPALAEGAAMKFTGSGVPGVMLKVLGEAVTPEGSPLSVTAMVPVNPLTAVAVSVSACALPPAVRPTPAGVTESEKSAGVGLPPPPPAPAFEASVPVHPQLNAASAPAIPQTSAVCAARRKAQLAGAVLPSDVLVKVLARL
jgi:hypothetical protein